MSNKELDDAMAGQFQGNFLDANDLIARGNITVTIEDVVPPNLERDACKKLIDKPILSFKSAKKRLILNKTNSKIISLIYGVKASAWIGQPITLTVRVIESAFGQKNLPVVRVVPPNESLLSFKMRSNYGKPLSQQVAGNTQE